MISGLTLNNFKCFKSRPLLFADLTVLTGQNGVGKSTVIQALLLSHEASLLSADGRFIKLNGPNRIELGTVSDILPDTLGEESESKIAFALSVRSEEDFAYWFESAAAFHANPYLSLIRRSRAEQFVVLKPFGFLYLSAERLGPRDTQGVQAVPRDTMCLGPGGEYAADVLARFEKDEVRPELRYAGSTNSLLGKQLEFWMGSLIPGVQIRTEPYAHTNVTSIRVRTADLRSDWMRPTNFGFGFSYALPILLGGLLAPAGGLFIVENPEAHLHPGAQAKIAYFLSRLALSGVQVVVETHSEHIVNGFRIAAAGSTTLQAGTIIHFFSRQGEPPELTIQSISVLNDGGLSSWPAGFFDQEERDLARLFQQKRA